MLYTFLVSLSMVSTTVVSHLGSLNPSIILQLVNLLNSIKSYIFAQHLNL